jgi:ectoine hydroxylase-related dioxygenase (phytanoyl-CoA dioxygenase family)
MNFLEWDLEVGDCVYFDIRTLHGALHEATPRLDINRFTLKNGKRKFKNCL